MAKHDVTFSVSERPIGSADLIIKIKRDGKAHGRLKISQGGIEWVPKDKSYGHHLTWKDFNEKMKPDA